MIETLTFPSDTSNRFTLDTNYTVVTSDIRGLRPGDIIFDCKERSDVCVIKVVRKTWLFKMLMVLKRIGQKFSTK